MGKYFKTSTVPIVDYGFKLPFEELFSVVKYKQDRYDESLANISEAIALSADWNAIPGSVDEQYVNNARNNIRGLTNKYKNQDLSMNYGNILADINSLSSDPRLIKAQKSYLGWQQYQNDYATLASAGKARTDMDPFKLGSGWDSSERGVFSERGFPQLTPFEVGQDIFGQMTDEDRADPNMMDKVEKSGFEMFVSSQAGQNHMKDYLRMYGGDYGDIDPYTGLPAVGSEGFNKLGRLALRDVRQQWEIGNMPTDIQNINFSSSFDDIEYTSPSADLVEFSAEGNFSGGTWSPTTVPIVDGTSAMDIFLGIPRTIGSGENEQPLFPGQDAYTVSVGPNSNNQVIRLNPTSTIDRGVFNLDLGLVDGNAQPIPNADVKQQQKWNFQAQLASGFFGDSRYEAWKNSDGSDQRINEAFTELQREYGSKGMYVNPESNQFQVLEKNYQDYIANLDENALTMERSIGTILDGIPQDNWTFVVDAQRPVYNIDGQLFTSGQWMVSTDQMENYFTSLYRKGNEIKRFSSDPGGEWEQVWGEGGNNKFTRFWEWSGEPDWDNPNASNITDFANVVEGADGNTYYAFRGYTGLNFGPQEREAYDNLILSQSNVAASEQPNREDLATNFVLRSLTHQNYISENIDEGMQRDISNAESLLDPRGRITPNLEIGINTMKQILDNDPTKIFSDNTKSTIKTYLDESNAKFGSLNKSEQDALLSNIAELNVYLNNYNLLDAQLKTIPEKERQTAKFELEKAYNYKINDFIYKNIITQSSDYSDITFNSNGIITQGLDKYKQIGGAYAKNLGLVQIGGTDNMNVSNQVYVPYVSKSLSNKISKLNEIFQRNNISVNITSAYRTPTYNDKLSNSNKSNSKTPSLHLRGSAFDFVPTGGMNSNATAKIKSKDIAQSVANLGLRLIVHGDHFHVEDMSDPMFGMGTQE
tara:strand:+ start:2591 stop:5380 length:2790 start_codon:yes stop_codon:yes gene_type:complete